MDRTQTVYQSLLKEIQDNQNVIVTKIQAAKDEKSEAKEKFRLQNIKREDHKNKTEISELQQRKKLEAEIAAKKYLELAKQKEEQRKIAEEKKVEKQKDS